ncbi:CRISPR-associated protein Cas5 [Aeromicrobium fastidiosum]|uniref:CRISPR-associated protein Cas5 n=1 Tax=Aeromicrobium fastidiosum TaxID=52699 RepID=UPI00355629B4
MSVESYVHQSSVPSPPPQTVIGLVTVADAPKIEEAVAGTLTIEHPRVEPSTVAT